MGAWRLQSWCAPDCTDWKRCVNESIPWTPPPDLDMHALELGIKTWGSPGQVRAFSIILSFLEQDMVQWTQYWITHVWSPDHMTTTTASMQDCLCSTEVQPGNRVLMIHQEEHRNTVPTVSAWRKTLTKILQEYFWWVQQTCEITQSPGSLVGGQGKCFLGETVGGLLLILQGPSS